jgi:hypothetical protein
VSISLRKKLPGKVASVQCTTPAPTKMKERIVKQRRPIWEGIEDEAEGGVTDVVSA